MKRVAIVSPRCHEKIVGGAEALAWQYAQLLASDYAVELLTSTASDYAHWANDLPEGVEVRDDVTIRRFRVARERGPYFHELHRKLLGDVSASAEAQPAARLRWTEALQEEFVRAQGPLCPGLIAHLEHHGDEYAAVIFVTYLYATTYDGARALSHRRWAIVPTVHDEPPAYFGIFAQMARHAPRLLWNTVGERDVGKLLWGVDRGNMVAMTVDTTKVEPARESTPYLLYSGRIDSHKGCAMLIQAFERYKAVNPSALRLLLTGSNQLGIVDSDHVRYLGFVDESRKRELMAGALAFVHPSPYESLSIVALEAMACGAALVCTPRGGLPEVAGDAALYAEPEADALAAGLEALIRDPARRVALGAAGVARAAGFGASAAARALMALRHRILA